MVNFKGIRKGRCYILRLIKRFVMGFYCTWILGYYGLSLKVNFSIDIYSKIYKFNIWYNNFYRGYFCFGYNISLFFLIVYVLDFYMENISN